MPVLETKMPQQTALDSALIHELIAELQNPKPTGQPLIEIRHVGPEARHVYVIWDKWETCQPQIRPKIVREAFSHVRGPEFESTISVAIAATFEEAIDTGMLPFEVKALRSQLHTAAQKKAHRKAFAEEGAVAIGSGQALTLRFPTLDQAEAALSRLQSKEPKIEWGIIQNPDRPD